MHVDLSVDMMSLRKQAIINLLKKYVTALSIIFNKKMKNIYQETIQKVSQGARFKVNFQCRSLKVDGKYVIKDGKYDGDLDIPQCDDTLNELDNLYFAYRHSLPTERSEAKRKCYFRALPEHELSDEDMMFGEQRDIAQVKLELFVLGNILQNTLKWENFAPGQWFWKSTVNPNLVLLKEWFEPTNE